jgi:DNA invertase Pin-like site-specific DNA recombinase
MTNKLVIGYCRISSVEGANIGVSIPRQKDLIESYCKFKGIQSPIFEVDEAISGFKANRPAFQRVLDMVRQGSVQFLIVNDLSRLARNVKLTLETVALLEKHKVTLISLSEDIKTDTAIGKFFLTVCSSFHQMVRDQTSEKMKSCWSHKRTENKKTGGYVPYGYVVDSNKNLIELESEQQVLRKIISLRQEGKTFREVSEYLNRSNIPTKTQRGHWYPNTVKTVLDLKGGIAC